VSSAIDPTAPALRHAVTQLGRRLRAERGSREAAADAVSTQSVSALGLSVLGRLHTGGPSTAGVLAAAEHLQPQSLTRVLATLNGQGLIRRARDPKDARQLTIEITQAGTALLLERVSDGDRWLSDELGRAFTPVERRILALAADILNDYLDERPRP
jgi:DNA-binding MarR family transcriptional regulator